jgi:hypothetical protein
MSYAKAKHEHMGILIRQRAQPIEFLLTGCIP